MLYHFRLVYSKYSYVKVILGGESFRALSEGLKEALAEIGDSPKDMILSDVPLAANVQVGDTIVTGGMSAIFPKHIDLGVIRDVIVPTNDNYYQLHISLFQDMTNLDYVYGVVIPKAETIKEMIIYNE